MTQAAGSSPSTFRLRRFRARTSRWRDLAACADADPSLFFPVGTGPEALRASSEAKSICARCPGRAGCLRFAIESNQQYGIWGGLDEVERRDVRRRRRAALRADAAAPRYDGAEPARALR